MYRLTIDDSNRIKLPEELLLLLKAKKGTVLIGQYDAGKLTFEKADEGPEPSRTEVEIIQTDVFWLPAEIAYFADTVRVRCKDPFVEVWADDRKTGLEKFSEAANKLYHK